MSAQAVDTFEECSIDLQLQQEMLDHAKKRMVWNANRSRLAPMARALAILKLEPTFTGEFNISFTGDKDALVNVVRLLRIHGWNTHADKPKKGDSSWCAWYNHPECPVQIWLYFTSSVCRRVKVGTKMEQVDVYETQCGDISDDSVVITQDFNPTTGETKLLDEVPF